MWSRLLGIVATTGGILTVALSRQRVERWAGSMESALENWFTGFQQYLRWSRLQPGWRSSSSSSHRACSLFGGELLLESLQACLQTSSLKQITGRSGGEPCFDVHCPLYTLNYMYQINETWYWKRSSKELQVKWSEPFLPFGKPQLLWYKGNGHSKIKWFGK